MAKLIIDNITLEQAKELASWYEGQGEQDADVWLEERGLRAPLVDVYKDFIVTSDSVTVTCKGSV